MICSWILGGVGLFAAPTQETPDALLVGHWVQVRGRRDKQGQFVASRVEVLEPDRYEAIIAIAEAVGSEKDQFVILGQPVDVDPEVDFEGLSRGRWGGKRVKLEGRWRDQWKFSARKIRLRSGSGRDRIEGRVDAIEKTTGGYLVRIMAFEILLPGDLEIRHEKPLASIRLSPRRGALLDSAQTRTERNDDLDDEFGGGIPIGENMGLYGQLVGAGVYEDNYNIDDTDNEDELALGSRVRLRLHWFAHPSAVLVTEVNIQGKINSDNGNIPVQSEDLFPRLGENFIYWTNAFGVEDLDFQFGRQDFDDWREWIYDENLDALRAFWSQPTYAVEASISTQIGGNHDVRDRGSLNSSLYVSNNRLKRHLAGYLFYRDIDPYTRGTTQFTEEKAMHIGMRALGEWIPDTKGWADMAYLVGERQDRNVSAFGYDIGATWSPDFADPFYMTLGYALGRGDTQTTGTDTRFSQTGFQDNSGRFGGVSSFRYYGELLRPELTNLGIFTAGLGARITRNISLDLVYHDYRFDVVTDDLDVFDPGDFTDLNPDEIAAEADLGWEADLILGIRAHRKWDIKIIGAYFSPGDAFPGGDDALFARVQVRYRF